ncbi:DUF4252 domain-containing protein [Bacteroides sp. OttesenSCG-928-E20]|nr:DUF4252 domain-containing protein [Bacteroides sp. OttesenSCG-928-N06]MDL2299271.1 DUF4252 domain-containing protein [Bacteroides sp. OttesenSCG-928-E20]MDL2306391.1 DUF4252 domain-containing protein [Bacteroides sp. OttesenSCG-928-D19]
MERVKVLLISLVLFVCSFVAHAQSSIFNKYSEKSDVSSVYISKTMLEMQPNVYTKDVNIGKVAGQLEAVYIISTKDNTIKRGMRSDIEDFIKKGKYEVLMKQKGLVSSSSFYVKKKGDKVKELVMITDGTVKFSYIHLVGEMTLDDIQRITNSQNISYHLVYPCYKNGIKYVESLDLAWLEETLEDISDDVLRRIDIKLAGLDIKY